jgi:hypothetical protein
MKQILFKKPGLGAFLLHFTWICRSLPAHAQAAPAPAIQVPAAQAPEAQVPEALVSEWRTFGVDPDLSRQLLKRFIKSREVLIKKFAQENLAQKNLATFADASPNKVPPLLKKFASNVAVSANSRPAAVGASLVYEPVLCRLADRYIVHLGAADTVLGTFRGSAHSSFDARTFEWDARDPARENNLDDAIAALANRITITGDGKTQDNSALHVGMALSKEHTRRDEGSALCALTLMAQTLLDQKFTVVRPWGGETLGKIRNSLGLPANLRRPTRTLVFRWNIPRTPKSRQTRLNPMPLKAEINVAEAVLGQPLPKIPETTWNGRVGDDGQINLTPSNTAMMDFLLQERTALSLAEAPQVAKINRAWVYLDKGRAYGLEMDDRLVINDGPPNYGARVKGHVVGFFGPEKKIVSPRGFPVNEGAIVFIRKGQAEAKIGQTFVYDETVFPTAYPAGGK